jgi:hypothetical protein
MDSQLARPVHSFDERVGLHTVGEAALQNPNPFIMNVSFFEHSEFDSDLFADASFSDSDSCSEDFPHVHSYLLHRDAHRSFSTEMDYR